MEINKYIESGILEAYVLGSASEAETREVLQFKNQYPEIRAALFELETDLERIALSMAIPPPPGMLTRIEDNINALVITPEAEPKINDRQQRNRDYYRSNNNQFIEVEAESSHMRIHKTWKWVFAAVFVLSKIFLIAFIYYYLENRQAQEQIQQLKSELKHYQAPR